MGKSRLGPRLGVATATVAALVFYFLLAATLNYSLPLAFLHGELPMMARSFKASMRNVAGLLVILGPLLMPYLIGAVAFVASAGVAFLLQALIGAVVLPVAACSLYCSYRTLFPTHPRPS